jgi:deoxyadenosine/deoxycytidine kinase
MPLPPSPSTEVRHERIVKLLRKTSDDTDQLRSYTEFLQQEMEFWSADLQHKQQEGSYYLDWLSWVDLPLTQDHDPGVFRKLVTQDLPALKRRIEERAGTTENESNFNGLLSLQKAYQGFCERFDQFKLSLLGQVEMGGNFIIF